jgi:putative exporter of polyketide antibiotics
VTALTGLAAAGWAFAAVGAVAAQLTSGAGAARGIAVGVLGGTWLLRVIGDVSGLSGGGVSWLSWLSPIGWAHRLSPYAGERWWVLLLPSPWSPSGPRSRWGDMVADNQNLKDVFTRMGGRTGIVDAYLVSVMAILGLLAAGYAIQATLRQRAEETSGRAEPVLATAVGRLRWAASHLVFSVIGSALALVAAGLTVGLTYGATTPDLGHHLSRVLEGALVQVPAVWVLGAVAVALVGLAPRFAAVAWGALGLCVLLGLVGPALQLDQWVMDLSPFTHVPKVPGGTLTAAPLGLLLAVALAVGGAGLAGLRRRGIPAT